MEIVSNIKKFNFKAFLSKKPIKIVVTLLLLVIIGLAVYKSSFVQSKLITTSQVVQRTANVQKGDIKVTVNGSGAIYFVKSQETVSKVDGIVKKLYFKTGDKVKAGDLIAELDDNDQQQKVVDAENNYAKTELSNDSTYKDESNLTIKAPFTGQVTGISVNTGDEINKGDTILTITDTSKLKVTLPFNAADIKLIKVGNSVDVNVTSLMQVVKGTVTYASSQPTASASGALLYNVEIGVSNPGSLTENMEVSADVSTTKGIVSSITGGQLSFINKTTVKSKVAGTAQYVSVRENQQVKSGETIVRIQSDEVEKSSKTASLNIESAQKQVDAANEKLEYYKIYAPFDGTIIAQDINLEDSLKAGSVIAKIADTSQLAFDVSIDELDISKMKVGQKVSTTFDAFTETSITPINGEVSKIAMEGTSQNGVTTYTVTIKITDNYEKVKSGMNANGEILVSNVTDVLYVPIETIQKRGDKSFVYVKSNGSGAQTQGMRTPPNGGFGQGTDSNNNSGVGGNSTGNFKNSNRSTGNANNSNRSSAGSLARNNSFSKTNNNYYANSTLKVVEVGAYNDSYIEIKSGLSEGDTVILPQIQTSSTTQSTNTQGGFGGFGGAARMSGAQGGYQGGNQGGAQGGTQSRNSSGGKN